MSNFGAETWLAIGLGFIAGLATLWTFGRWLKFVSALGQESPNVAVRRKSRRRILGIPLLGFAQPTPWLTVIGLPFAAYYSVVVRQSQSGTWFFSMIGVVVLCWLIGEAALSLRAQRRHRERGDH